MRVFHVFMFGSHVPKTAPVAALKEHKARATLIAELLEAVDTLMEGSDGDDGIAEPKDFHGLIDRIAVQRNRLHISVNLEALLEGNGTSDPIPVTFEIRFKRRQNGRAKPIIIASENVPYPDPDLIALVADARRWASELLDGKVASIQQITDREGLRSGVVSRILPLAWLAPDISTAILEGRQPQHLNAKTLRTLPDLPADWTKQRQILGFAPV